MKLPAEKNSKKISDSLLTRAAADKQEVPRGIALYASILSDYVAKVDSKPAKKTDRSTNQHTDAESLVK